MLFFPLFPYLGFRPISEYSRLDIILIHVYTVYWDKGGGCIPLVAWSGIRGNYSSPTGEIDLSVLLVGSSRVILYRFSSISIWKVIPSFESFTLTRLDANGRPRCRASRAGGDRQEIVQHSLNLTILLCLIERA